MKTRLAPTPSGFLHAGNGADFVLAWKLARRNGGQVLLRIDDLDAERVRSEYVQDVFDTLQWLGLDWDEGPADPMDLARSWSQQHRVPRYRALMARLRAEGHLYACTCSRSEVQQRTGSTAYDGHCRDRGAPMDTPDCAWRLRLPRGASVAWHTWPEGKLRETSLDLPDPVIRQRNGRPAYQIASLADDVHFGVDTIVRGRDLLPSTAIQQYLAKLLEMPTFGKALFLHHSLVLGPSGEKRSKSKGAGSLRAIRLAGGDPMEVHRLARKLLAGG